MGIRVSAEGQREQNQKKKIVRDDEANYNRNIDNFYFPFGYLKREKWDVGWEVAEGISGCDVLNNEKRINKQTSREFFLMQIDQKIKKKMKSLHMTLDVAVSWSEYEHLIGKIPR